MPTGFSPNVDIKGSVIKDFIEERLVRVYPYFAPNMDKTKNALDSGTFSWIEINQLPYSNGTGDFKCKQDENGHWYFEAFAVITSQGIMDISSQTSGTGTKLKEEKQFQIATNDHIQLFKPIYKFFTIDEVLDPAKWMTGDIDVYVSTDTLDNNPYTLSELQNANYVFQPDNVAILDMMNAKGMEQQFDTSRMGFYFKTSILDSPKVTNSEDSESFGIQLGLQNNSLINHLKGKALVGGEVENLSLYSETTLAPFKLTPISYDNNILSMFSDWFDNDTVLPYVAAKLFIVSSGTTLGSLGQISGVDFLGQKERECILDMLAISAAYANNFSQFERWSYAEVKSLTGLTEGSLKAGQTIGYSNTKITSLVGQDPIKTVDGIYEKYLRENSLEKESTKAKAIKQVINALSRYIYSSYCIGKGSNSFNEAYLPWFLVPQSAITFGTPDLYKLGTESDADAATGGQKRFILKDTDVKFILDSQYFDIDMDTHVINLKENINLSELHLIQTDRKLTMPVLQQSIEIIDKLPLPGDIDTKSSKDLKFEFFAPLTVEQARKALLESMSTATSSETDIPYTLNSRDWDYYRVSYPNGEYGNLPVAGAGIEAYAKQAASNLLGQPVDTITIQDVAALPSKIAYDVEQRNLGNHPLGTSHLLSQVTDFNRETQNVPPSPFGVPGAHGQVWGDNFVPDDNGNGKPYILSFRPGDGNYVRPNTAGTDMPVRRLTYTGDRLKALLTAAGFDMSTVDTISGSFVLEVYKASMGHNQYSEQYTFWQSNNISWTVKKYYLRDFVASSSNTVTIASLGFDNRKTIFNKTTWALFLKNQLGITRQAKVKLNLLSEGNFPIDKIYELSLGIVWGDEVDVIINGQVFTTPLFNKDLENLGIQKIIWT